MPEKCLDLAEALATKKLKPAGLIRLMNDNRYVIRNGEVVRVDPVTDPAEPAEPPASRTSGSGGASA